MTDADVLRELIAKLGAATEPTRELADEVLLAIGWRYDEATVSWISPGRRRQVNPAHRPNPLESMDAAISLVPEGWHWQTNDVGEAWCGTHFAHDKSVLFKGSTTTPAHALTIAALRARLADMEARSDDS